MEHQIHSTLAISVVCALLERDGTLLAAKRTDKGPRGGKWEFPGGKIEAGESPEHALVREVAEELGCVVRPIETWPWSTHAYDDLTVTLVPIRCELTSGEPVALEHAELRWACPDDLERLDWAEADLPIVRRYVVSKRKR